MAFRITRFSPIICTQLQTTFYAIFISNILCELKKKKLFTFLFVHLKQFFRLVKLLGYQPQHMLANNTHTHTHTRHTTHNTMDNLMVYVNLLLNCFRRAAFNAQSHKQFTVSCRCRCRCLLAALSVPRASCLVPHSLSSCYANVRLANGAYDVPHQMFAFTSAIIKSYQNLMCPLYRYLLFLLLPQVSSPVRLTIGQFVSPGFLQQQQQQLLCACIYQIVK